eukprot:TRINITY_DN29495_c0_g1_i1.p1 TRINITY_DN29495_c0_g1~~TRINITY_DN29495_c0_g1_i1.p1  ORF type:complete len:104 (-),score=22.82 TRINITY_DN29495_c0_g1_i1:108-419(-)
MVCDTCQKKLDTIATPEVWKEGSRGAEPGQRKVGENKLLSKSAKRKFEPYGKGGVSYGSVCRICKSQLHQSGNYCQGCAYKKGICAMCGKKVLDTKGYKMSST